ncbi:MAG: GAF domain-containing protein [Chloroflexi bacterium]|nr:GAF domain-containing protein [Chloroflexota bacterium]
MESQDALRNLQLEVSRLRDENRALKEELTSLRGAVRGLDGLHDVIQRIRPGVDILQLLDDLLASALAVVGASDGSLLLLDEETNELVFAVVRGQAAERLRGYRLPPGKGIAGWVAAHRKAEVVHDVHSDPRFFPDVDETFGFETHTLACVPLLEGSRVLGVIEALNKSTARGFLPQDHDLLLVVAVLASVALRRAEATTDERGAA